MGMYDGKAAGGAGGSEYIQILSRWASIGFALFIGFAAWLLTAAAWQWTVGLILGYIGYNLWLCRRYTLPGAGELLVSLLLCAGLTYVQAEFSNILYHLLLMRTALRVGRRRIGRVTAMVMAAFLAATLAATGISVGPAEAARIAFNLLGFSLVAYAAARLDLFLAKQASDDQQMLELIKQNDRNYHMALTDALTGLYNHRAYKERIDSLPQYVLLIVDIDHFKKLNDAHGHLVGDKVLVTIGNIIKLSVRSGDLAFRYGGEEFVVVLPGTTPQMGMKIAERLRQKVAEWEFESGAGRIPVTVSIGMAVRRPGMSSQAIFEQADRALYRAKQLGRNNVQPYSKVGPEVAVKFGV